MAVISLASLPEPPKIRTDGILGSVEMGLIERNCLKMCLLGSLHEFEPPLDFIYTNFSVMIQL